MANPEHLAILKQGTQIWNEWRKANPQVKPDLEAADLSGTDLSGASLYDANLNRANLSKANLRQANLNCKWSGGTDWSDACEHAASLMKANLQGADLRDADLRFISFCGADLRGANLSGANLNGYEDRDGVWATDLSRADLSDANLSGAHLLAADLTNADLSNANLSGADLRNADISRANLTEADLSDAVLSNCRVYGSSAWDTKLERTTQKDLVISKRGEPYMTVDNLEVAQFIHLILNNAKLREAIDVVTAKGVLILGRFSEPERKAVLDGLREKLREFGLLPMVFDFERPTDKDYTETVQTLAGMSKFVIADVTSPKSTPLELEATVKHFKIPYIPIIDVSVDPRPFAMLVDLQKSFHWVLPTFGYHSKEELLDHDNLKTYIIDRAVAKREELRRAKNEEPEMLLIQKKAPN